MRNGTDLLLVFHMGFVELIWRSASFLQGIVYECLVLFMEFDCLRLYLQELEAVKWADLE